MRFLLRGFGLVFGFGFSMGGNTMTVSMVTKRILHLLHIRDRVLPSGISLGLLGKTFRSVDSHLGQASMRSVYRDGYIL